MIMILLYYYSKMCLPKLRNASTILNKSVQYRADIFNKRANMRVYLIQGHVPIYET